MQMSSRSPVSRVIKLGQWLVLPSQGEFNSSPVTLSNDSLMGVISIMAVVDYTGREYCIWLIPQPALCGALDYMMCVKNSGKKCPLSYSVVTNIFSLLWRRKYHLQYFSFYLLNVLINSQPWPESKECIIVLLCGWEGELFLCVLLIRVTLSNCAVMHIKKKVLSALLQAYLTALWCWSNDWLDFKYLSRIIC